MNPREELTALRRMAELEDKAAGVTAQPPEQPEQSLAGKAIDLVSEGAKTFANTLTGTAKDAKEIVAPSNVEDLPELSTLGLGEDFQLADTPQGMLNIANKARRGFREFTGESRLDTLPLTMGQDKFGNPVAVDADGNKFHFNKPGLSLNDADFVQKGVEKFAPLVVGGGISAPAKILAGPAVSGITGAISEAGGQAASNAAGSKEGADVGKIFKTGALAAAGDAGGRAIVKGLSTVFSRLGAKASDVNKFVNKKGEITPEGIAILEKNQLNPKDLDDLLVHELKKRGDDVLTPEQAGRFNTLKSEGFEPTKPQVTQKPNDFRAQQELAKTNPDVQSRLAAQNTTAAERVPNLVNKTGANELDGSGVVSAITSKRLEIDNAIGNIYKQVRESSPKGEIVNAKKLVTKLREANKSDLTNGVINSVEGELKRLGILNSSGGQNVRANISKGLEGKKITVNQAEDLRVFLNSLNDFKNPNIANSLIRDLKTALDDDVTLTGGRDFFLKARKLKIAERKEFAADALKKNKFDRGSKNILDDISSGKISGEKFTDKIISRSTTSTDLKNIKSSLTSGSKEQVERGNQAWNDLRGEILDKGFQKSTQKKGELGPVWDRDIWSRYIKNLGDKKLKELFTGEERAFLTRLSNVDDLLKPVSGTGLGEGPSTLATNKIIQLMAKFPSGKAALGIKSTLDAAASPVLGAAKANEILNPAQATIKALKAYSDSIRRGSAVAPRLGAATGASESKK